MQFSRITSMLERETKTFPEFTRSDARISELLDHLHQIADLQALGAIAEWDQNTAMPGGAAEVRGFQVAALQGIIHELWTNPRLGNLLRELQEPVQQAVFTDADCGLVREALRAHERATKLPRKLVEELAHVQATSFEAWRSAREHSDFARFAPMLSRTITLRREVADHLGFAETRYDALLDEYEPGMTSSKLDRLFTPVREASRSLLQRIEASGNTIDASFLEGSFPAEQQIALCEHLLHNMGYDFSRGQMAQSPHPFTTSFGSPFDVRLTVRPLENFLQAALMAAIHEGGHAVYEQGVAPTLVRTLLASGASSGAHESQSRLWENAIGRAEPYWQGQFAAVKEAFPAQFAHTDIPIFVRALNKVQPSLITAISRSRRYQGSGMPNTVNTWALNLPTTRKECCKISTGVSALATFRLTPLAIFTPLKFSTNFMSFFLTSISAWPVVTQLLSSSGYANTCIRSVLSTYLKHSLSVLRTNHPTRSTSLAILTRSSRKSTASLPKMRRECPWRKPWG